MMTNEEFNKTVKVHSNMIFRIAFGWLKSIDDANDVLQDVMIQLYLTDKSFESEMHIKNWLSRVTINQCKKVFRAPWRRREDIDEYINTLSFEQPDYLDLFQAVMRLDKKYRVPLILFYYDGYSTKQISDLMNLPENTISTRLARARKQLREYLKED